MQSTVSPNIILYFSSLIIYVRNRAVDTPVI